MSVTVYNPTTGRYVTTLNTSAGAKKQATTAAIKSKDGAQVVPLTPTASSVKVSLSTQGRAALTSTTKLKLGELITKLQDPKFSPSDLQGITLYVDSSLKEITDLASAPAPGPATYDKLLNLLTSQSGGKLMEVRANNDAPVTLDPTTYQTIQDAPNPAARALLDVVSNFSLDLPTGSDGRVACGITSSPSVLASFKHLIDTNRATKVTIDGQVSPVTLTPDIVTALGPKTLARYPGKIVIDANSANLLTPTNWENMRVLNNYHELSINLNQGVPASTTPIATLSPAMSKLTYQQFIGGFNLLGSISTTAAPVALEPAAYNAGTKSQKVLFSGQFLNGDMVQVDLAPSGMPKASLSVGPLVLPNGASPDQQGEALLTAFRNALAKNSDYADLTVSRTGNALNLTWSGAGPGELPPIDFVNASHVQDSAASFGVDLTDVPPSAAQSLTAYPQIYSVQVKGTADQLIMNSDKLNKLITSGFVKSTVLSETGTVKVTASQAVRSIPLLEKIGVNKITISDAPTAPSSYASFTSAAANNLVGGIRIVGSSADILKSISGLAALTRMGKISSLTMTGTNGRQTVMDNFDINKLSDLVVSLRKGT